MLYIDPSSVSILATTLSGIVIALSAVAVVWWRKVKKTVAKTFHIDENANKEVEEDVVINDDVTEAEQTAEPTETNEN